MAILKVTVQNTERYLFFPNWEKLEVGLRAYGSGWSGGSMSSQAALRGTTTLPHLVDALAEPTAAAAGEGRVVAERLLEHLRPLVERHGSATVRLEYEPRLDTPFFKKTVGVYRVLSPSGYALGLTSLERVDDPDADERGLAELTSAPRCLWRSAVLFSFPRDPEGRFTINFAEIVRSAVRASLPKGLPLPQARRLAREAYENHILPSRTPLGLGEDLRLWVGVTQALRDSTSLLGLEEHWKLRERAVLGVMAPEVREHWPETADVEIAIQSRDEVAIFDPALKDLARQWTAAIAETAARFFGLP